jgi:hypothetical protein
VLLPTEGLVELDALHSRPEVVAECRANLAEAEAEAQAALARGRLADLG